MCFARRKTLLQGVGFALPLTPPTRGTSSPLPPFLTLAARQRGKVHPCPLRGSVGLWSRVKGKPLRGRRWRPLTLQNGGTRSCCMNSGGMGACPHLRGRGCSRHKEAAAVRDGRGSPSHQHTVTGRQLYFLLLSAGGRESVTSKPFRGRGGGCRPTMYFVVHPKRGRET